MSLPLQSKFWTGEIADDSLEITEAMGAKAVSVLNRTAVSGSIIGSETLAGVGASSALSIAENQSISITADSTANALSGLTIKAPAGCTLQVIVEL